MISSKFNGFSVNLVETTDEADAVCRAALECEGTVGVDTETTGLDYTKDVMVGLCIAFGKPLVGYYLPIRHRDYKNNLPVKQVLGYAQEILDKKTTVYFNRNFDISMLEIEGIKVSMKNKWHDVQIMAWLTTNEKFPKLKDFLQRYLNYEVITYESEVDAESEEDKSFGLTDPTRSYVYAAFDPVGTVMLGRKLWNSYPYIKRVYPIDNLATEAVRLLSKKTVALDKHRIQEFILREESKLRLAKSQAVQITGYEFNPRSNKDKGEALSRFVTLSRKTKSGKSFSVDEETLSTIDHPLAQVLCDFAKTDKFINSYLKPLLGFADDKLRVNYKTVEVPTGRLSSGQVRKNPYYSKFNIQSTPKEEVKLHVIVDESSPTGYSLSEDSTNSLGIQKVKAGVRTCFPARDGRLFVTIDYKAQELRIAANLSREPIWLNAILSGKDPHMETARGVFGLTDANSRTFVKITNFSVLYGASAYSLHQKLKIPLEKAQDMFNKYFKSMRRLKLWIDSVIETGRKKGMVFTYFGRPRILYQYYNSSERGMQAFADRSAVNSTVQGCLPANIHLELDGSAVLMKNLYGKSMVCRSLNNKELEVGVVTGRGTDGILKVITHRGHNLYCSLNHKIVVIEGNKRLVLPVLDCLGKRAELRKPQKKLWSWKSIKGVWKTRKALKEYLSHLLPNREEVVANSVLTAQFFIAWLLRMELNPEFYNEKGSLSSIASVAGFSIVEKGKICMVDWSRPKSSTITNFAHISDENVQVGSVTKRFSEAIYPSQGFSNKNTGGDVMRIALIKVFEEFENNITFRENVDIMSSIHDELNFYVDKSFLYTFFIRIKELMIIKPDNWTVPLDVEIGVGTNWGNCITISDVKPDNTIVPDL